MLKTGALCLGNTFHCLSNEPESGESESWCQQQAGDIEGILSDLIMRRKMSVRTAAWWEAPALKSWQKWQQELLLDATEAQKSCNPDRAAEKRPAVAHMANMASHN